LVHGTTYLLRDTLRRWLVQAGMEWMASTLRLRLIKRICRVRQSGTRVQLRLASGHPCEVLWHRLTAAKSAHE
jgi:hypothetical protein